MVKDPLVLFRLRGPQEFHYEESNILEDFGFTSGKVGGSTYDSLYLVYSKNNYINFSKETVKIVDSPNMIEFGFVVRSFQAANEVGISFFNKYYSGRGVTFERSCPLITIAFEDGASSFIVMKGVWAIYRKEC